MALCAHSQKKKRFELLFLAVERSSEYSWRQTKLPLSIAIIKWILGFCDILVYRCGQGRTKKQTNIKIKKNIRCLAFKSNVQSLFSQIMSVYKILCVAQLLLRNRALCVLLCDAVARGLIQPLTGADRVEPALPGDRGRNRADKGVQKTTSVHGDSLDPAALQDVCKALEVCQCLYSMWEEDR